MQELIYHLKEKGLKDQNGIWLHAGPDSTFEKLYLASREKEGRIYTIPEIGRLPNVIGNQILAWEWAIRKKSADKLIAYLHKKNTSLKVLEIGCGNGWLTNMIAKQLPKSYFVGNDINYFELKQAAEAFSIQKNIDWVCDRISEDLFPANYFDIIFFAASIQYFDSVGRCIKLISNTLAKSGEIHIMDTAFYQPAEIPAAQNRSKEYYQNLGIPEMIEHYYHYTTDELYNCGLHVKKLNRTSPFTGLKKFLMPFGFDYFGWYMLKV